MVISSAVMIPMCFRYVKFGSDSLRISEMVVRLASSGGFGVGTRARLGLLLDAVRFGLELRLRAGLADTADKRL